MHRNAGSESTRMRPGGGSRVFVTRPIPAAGLERLHAAGLSVEVYSGEEPVPRAALLAGVREAAGLLCLLTDRVDGDVLAAAPRLRVVSLLAAGYDNVDLEACRRRGVVVTNTPDVLTEATADLTWALLLAAARRLGEAERCLRSGRWRGWGPLQFLGRELRGRVLGIVGAGRIGSAVARRAPGFGLRVLYTSRTPKPALEAELGARRASLKALLRESDFVTLHVPLTPETHHLLNAERLGWLKRGAVLVNTSRGPVVDEAALARALREGRLAAAGLDVYEREPAVHPDLLALENVVLLPHIGSATEETRARMAALAAENLLAVLAGREPRHRVV